MNNNPSSNCIVQLWRDFLKESHLWKIFFIIYCVLVIKSTFTVFKGFVVTSLLETPFFTTGGIVIALLSAYVLYLLASRMMRYADYSKRVLALAFLWGMGAIYFIAHLKNFFPASLESLKVTPVFSGIIEEIVKAIFLFALGIVGRKYFTSVLAGVIIGWFLGMGFSLFENMSYYGSFLQDEEYAGIVFRFVTGSLTGNHALYSGLIGGGIGYVLNRYHAVNLVWLFPFILLPSILLHTIHNNLLGNTFVPVAILLSTAIVVFLLTKGVKWHRNSIKEK